MNTQTRLGLTAAGIVLGIALSVIGFAVLANSRATVGAALLSSFTSDWTHRELLGHLDRRGLRLQAIPSSYGSLHGPAMHFSPEPIPWYVDEWMANGRFQPGVVYVQLCDSEQTARERAGVLDRGGFAWQRFLFAGDTQVLAKIRPLLP